MIKVVLVSAEGKKFFRIHLGLVLAELICVPAFVVELFRALGGNELSWAYVFEWPLLGVYAVYMWHKMIVDERGDTSPAPEPVAAVSTRSGARALREERRLAEWNAYLEQVHESRQATPESREV